MRRFLIGVASGAVLGYAFIRTREALETARRPPLPLAPDSKTYGRTRRALMLAGMARSLATLAASAYALAPLAEARDGAREPRARRMALVATSLVASTLLELPA
ncbi:MAG: hypothetical protein IAI48_02820, partial [Candidatus Eremiobacteraeota bacterium]|nr:hypothetical protein [Candidatus Eremiobacteraeota bacterium]